MKQFYLILIAFLSILSCSKNDSIEEELQQTEFDYTLEVKSTQVIDSIKVEKLDEHLNPIETYSLSNTDSLIVNLNISRMLGESFIVHGYDTHGLVVRYKLWRNEPRGIAIDGLFVCNGHCFKHEHLP